MTIDVWSVGVKEVGTGLGSPGICLKWYRSGMRPVLGTVGPILLVEQIDTYAINWTLHVQ